MFGFMVDVCESDELDKMFEVLIVVLLQRVIFLEYCCVIFIDVLDECESGGKNVLFELIVKRFGKVGVLSSWLWLVVMF